MAADNVHEMTGDTTTTERLFAFFAALASDPQTGSLQMGDLRILGVIAAQKTGITIAELIAATKISPKTLARSIDWLVDNGHVERAIDAEDRRRINVSLTPKGSRLYARIAGIWRNPK